MLQRVSWYRKPEPTFSDVLMALRADLVEHTFFSDPHLRAGLDRILKAMEQLSDQEKEEVREEVLKRVEPFFRTPKDFDHMAQQDMASWQHRGMGVETRLCTLRNEVMEERFLSGR